VILVVLVGLVGAGIYYWQANLPQPNNYRTAKVERGPLTATVGATGTIQPEDVVDVGAQVAGRIERFGTDPLILRPEGLLRFTGALTGPGGAPALAAARLLPRKTIDYNTLVEKGTVLAELDPSLYQTQVDTAAADLERARADLLQMQAKLEQTQREFTRTLAAGKAVSATDVDVARANYETASANLKVGEAAINQKIAALKKAQINLDYTIIRSPVKGIIIERRVNVGQTVVSSLNAPSLFLIAKDLRRLQVWASVNEADIGQVRPGMAVKFTVDTYRDRVFEGVVAKDQPRLNAVMTSNVVTYTVVVETDNPVEMQGDLEVLVLKPYLTANLQFITEERANALKVPNAALRWRPQVSQVAADERAAYAQFLSGQDKKKREANANVKAGATAKGTGNEKKALGMNPRSEHVTHGTVWVAGDDGLVRPIKLKLGITDGSFTEVLEVRSGELSEGTDLIVGENRQADGGGGSNPFGPPAMFGSKKKES
jgi:HlyD family secretion protein